MFAIMWWVVGFDNSCSWAMNNQGFLKFPNIFWITRETPQNPISWKIVLNWIWEIALYWIWEIFLNWPGEMLYRNKIEMFAPVPSPTRKLHQHMSILVTPLLYQTQFFHYCTTSHNFTTIVQLCTNYYVQTTIHYWTALVSHSLPICPPANDGIAKDSLSTSSAAVYQIGQKSIAKNPLQTDFNRIVHQNQGAGHPLSLKPANDIPKYQNINFWTCEIIKCCSTRYVCPVRDVQNSWTKNIIISF